MLKNSLILLVTLPIFLTGLDIASKFFQNDYEVKNERYTLTWFNKSCFRYFTLTTYRFNRTTKVINMTSNSFYDINVKDAFISVQGFKFLSNEYRFFPISFQLDLCRILSSNILGFGTQRCGNYGRCPIYKDTDYYSCNWAPDHAKLPPRIPEGQYKFESKAYYQKELAFCVDYYVTVFRIVPIEGKNF